MRLLLFISAQFTYKRFLIFWALTGMLFTHSWLTSANPPTFYSIAFIYGNYLCGFFALICFFVSLLISKSNLHFKISRYVICIVLYVFMAAFSGVINNSTHLGLLLLRLAVPVIFCLSYIYFFSNKDVKNVIYGIAVFGLINVLFSYYVFFATTPDVATPFPVSGLITDRNGFGRYLSIVNAFFLIELISSRNNRQKILYSFFVVMIFFGILIQNSRSGYIVYIISSIIIIVASGSKSARKIAFALLPFVLGLFLFSLFQRIHSEKMNVANYSDLSRIYMLKAGVNMIQAHPFKGIGYGMSEIIYGAYADRSLPSAVSVKAIHNWFVAVWAEMGIAGFVVFCWLNISMMINLFKRFYRSGFIEGKYFLLVFSALVILMIDNMFLPNYDYESIYWVIIALGVLSLSKGQNDHGTHHDMSQLKAICL